MMRRQRTDGFTLIELLVVIAIIGILIALLLPAVQAAREASRRSACSNNLKQIGLALHNYNDVNKYLPFSRTFGKSTWMADILPFIEEKSAYDLFVPTANYDSSANQTFRQTVVAVYTCPSRRSPGPTKPDGSMIGSTTDYAGSIGAADDDDPNIASQYPEYVPANGPFQRLVRVKFKHITDGLSKTLFVGEKFVHADHFGEFRDSASNFQMDGGVFDGRASRGWNSTRAAGQSAIGQYAYPLADITNPQVPTDYVFCFGSTHVAICQFVFGDGAVRPIANSIDLVTLGHLADRAGGQSPNYGF